MTSLRRWALTGSALFLASCDGHNAEVSDREAVTKILATLDDRSLSVQSQLENYREDAVILVPNEVEHRGVDAIRKHLSGFGEGVDIVTRHEIVEFTSFDDLVSVQGRVVGTARPQGGDGIYEFETKNIILLRPTGDSQKMKIWKVIYNAAPTPPET